MTAPAGLGELIIAKKHLRPEFKRLFQRNLFLESQKILISDCYSYYLKEENPGDVALFKLSETAKAIAMREVRKEMEKEEATAPEEKSPDA